jgi:hypothetical protein
MIVNKQIGCLVILSVLFASSSFADDISASGRLSVRGVEALHNDSVKEDPGAAGRVKFEATGPAWQFHSWLEGEWDGTVRRPPRDHSLFKNYDTVYQSNSPYLEVKELYLQYSSTMLDLKAGIQRYSWGRLDEFPPNDLLNPWDF